MLRTELRNESSTHIDQMTSLEMVQLMNKENAMRILRSKLYQYELEKRRATQQAIEADKKRIEWGSQIRSYVLDDRRVKDHRTGFQTTDCDSVLDGDLDAFIKAYLMEFSGQ